MVPSQGLHRFILNQLFPNMIMLHIKFSKQYASKYFVLIHTLGPWLGSKIVSEYDQEIPQSQTADNPVAPRGRAAQPSRDTRKSN